MKRTIVAAAALALLLTACGGPPSGSAVTPAGNAPPSIVTFYADLPDGRRVLCVYAGWSNQGGPSCDWERAR